MTDLAVGGLEPLVPDLPPVEREPIVPAGFVAAGMPAGIKASGRPDLALIASTVGPVPAAAVFTPNPIASAPVRWSRARLPESADAGGGRCGLASLSCGTRDG